jgi:hypothetical protein
VMDRASGAPDWWAEAHHASLSIMVVVVTQSGEKERFEIPRVAGTRDSLYTVKCSRKLSDAGKVYNT